MFDADLDLYGPASCSSTRRGSRTVDWVGLDDGGSTKRKRDEVRGQGGRGKGPRSLVRGGVSDKDLSPSLSSTLHSLSLPLSYVLL